jgi:hypothetical protein
MERYLSLNFKSEVPVDFIISIAGDNFLVRQESVVEFRKTMSNSSPRTIFQGFLELMPKLRNRQLSNALFFYYLAINWTPFKSTNLVKSVVCECRQFTSAEEPTRFRNNAESEQFYFNKLLLSYVSEYAANLALIFSLKHLNVNPRAYTDLIIQGKIGFEYFFHMMKTFTCSFMLLDHLWARSERSENELDPLDKYLIEIIITRISEEYIFLKNVFKEILQRLEEVLSSEIRNYFLAFFEEFVWRNRKIIDTYEKRKEYFKEQLIRFPAIFIFEKEMLLRLTDLLIEEQLAVLHIKGEMLKFDKDHMIQLSLIYFEKVSGSAIEMEESRAIFEGREILGFLDMMQNHTKSFKKRRGTFTA